MADQENSRKVAENDYQKEGKDRNNYHNGLKYIKYIKCILLALKTKNYWLLDDAWESTHYFENW